MVIDKEISTRHEEKLCKKQSTVSGLGVSSLICYSGQTHNSMGRLMVITSNSVGSPICQ